MISFNQICERFPDIENIIFISESDEDPSRKTFLINDIIIKSRKIDDDRSAHLRHNNLKEEYEILKLSDAVNGTPKALHYHKNELYELLFLSYLPGEQLRNQQLTFFQTINVTHQVFKILLWLRNNYPEKNKTLVNLKLCNYELTIPFLHNITIYRRMYPLYLSEKYFDLTLIDIGANVGDTAAIIKCQNDKPILCIEGSEYYADLLIRNVEQFDGVYVENTFVGPRGNSDQTFTEFEGTGRILEKNEGHSQLKFDSLDNITQRNPEFKNTKFIKIDTDGYDNKIIRHEFEFINENRPVMYFEYNPKLLEKNEDDGLSIFKLFEEMNYNKLIIYNNYGEYLLMTEVKNDALLQDIHQFYLRFGADKYCDMCVFHIEDDDIAESIRINESIFFNDYANNL